MRGGQNLTYRYSGKEQVCMGLVQEKLKEGEQLCKSGELDYVYQEYTNQTSFRTIS